MDGKLLGIASTALRSNFAELKLPYKLNFCVTYSCQSRCRTCNIWQMRPKNELSIDEIRSFASKNNYFRWMELTGGEVFLRSDIDGIARAFHEHSKGLYALTMPTNSLCNVQLVERKLRSILELGIPRVVITVSLDGRNGLHDTIRGVPGNYGKAVSMARLLAELKGSYRNLGFVFGYTMSRLNQGQLSMTIDAVMDDVPGTTPNDFHVNLGQTSGNYYDNVGMDIKADGNAAAKEIRGLLKRRRFSADPMQIVEDAFLRKLAAYAETGRQPMRSRSLEASVFMDSFGDVYPSIMWDAKIGSVRDTDYDLIPILRSDAAMDIRRKLRKGDEPAQWTSCEAYQAIIGSAASIVR